MADIVAFGTAEYKGKWANLIITSIKKGTSSQKASQMDEDGNIIQMNRYGKEDTVQIEAGVKGDISAIEVGGTITVDDKEYGVDSKETTKTNTGHYTVSIAASRPHDPPAEAPAGG